MGEVKKKYIVSIEDSGKDRERIKQFLQGQFGEEYDIETYSDYSDYFKNENIVKNTIILITDVYIFGSYTEAKKFYNALIKKAKPSAARDFLKRLSTSRGKGYESIKQLRKNSELSVIAFTRFEEVLRSLIEQMENQDKQAKDKQELEEISGNIDGHTKDTARLLKFAKVPIVSKWSLQGSQPGGKASLVLLAEQIRTELDKLNAGRTV